MPPWWVYQKTGSGATSVWPFYVVLIVWVLCQTGQSHFTATPALNLTLSGACYRTARRGRASIFPVLVRFPPFACLSCRSPGLDLSFKGADMC